ATIPNLTPHHLHTTLTPKTDTALHLHHLTQHHPHLTTFILYSSAAATLGSPGQANYAAANAVLDALAHHRQAHGQPAQSLAWGLWQQTSTMTTHLTPTDHHRITTTGLTPLTTPQALTLYTTATTHHTHHPTLIPTHLNPHHPTPTPPLLHNLTHHHPTPTTPIRSAPPAPFAHIARLTTTEQSAALLALVQSQAAVVLGHDHPDDVMPNALFRDQGFDSLTAVELRNRLSSGTGLRLPSTLAFDYPTPSELAEHLRRSLLEQHSAYTSATSVMVEIDRLESLLANLGDEDAAHSRVAARLQSMLTRWTETRDQSDATPDSSALASATAAEVLDFIDNDLGLA
ncbi:KR domain-containing protein, partial [Streptomyces sp. AV19]